MAKQSEAGASVVQCATPQGAPLQERRHRKQVPGPELQIPNSGALPASSTDSRHASPEGFPHGRLTLGRSLLPGWVRGLS